MASWVVGGVVVLVVGLIVFKMIRDKKSGKSACSCGGDCGSCGASCPNHTHSDQRHKPL